jgi:sister chromatid cohesion protein DCC1
MEKRCYTRRQNATCNCQEDATCTSHVSLRLAFANPPSTTMSSQPNTTTIPFSIAHHQSPIRLLELPPAILTLINTASLPTLQIKAAPSSASSHAVLCTATQTFALRQVHSSNKTFLLTPSSGGGVTVTSTATSYLELLPSTEDAKSILKPNLLSYPTTSTPPGKTKAQLIRDIPVSDDEFLAAWQALAAFEHAGSCYVPTAAALLKAVKAALTNATAAGVRLEVPFEISKLIDEEEEEELPRPLIVAAMGLVCTTTPEGWVLDPQRCVEMVGRWVLQGWSEAGKGDLLYVAFLKMWKAAVPESCKGMCKLEVLKVGLYQGKWGRGANGHRIGILCRRRTRLGLWRRERRRQRNRRPPPRGRRISGMKGLGRGRSRVNMISAVGRRRIGQYTRTAWTICCLTSAR